MAVYCRINGVVASVMESAGRSAKVYRRELGVRLVAFAGRRGDVDRDLFDDANAESFQGGHTARMVGKQADTRDIQVREDLGADAHLPLRPPLMVGQCGLAALMMKEDGLLVADLLNRESFST